MSISIDCGNTLVILRGYNSSVYVLNSIEVLNLCRIGRVVHEVKFKMNFLQGNLIPVTTERRNLING